MQVVNRVYTARIRPAGRAELVHRAQPRGYCKIRPSGAAWLAGFVTQQEAHRCWTRALRANHVRAAEVVRAPTLVNLVATAQLPPQRLSLATLAAQHPDTMVYRPQQFSAVIFRPSRRGVALIFASGAVVLTGNKSVREAERLWELVIAHAC
jgi:TATA-box binding protein (TBP) (component of TFIID and TFIIIB)